MTKRADPMVGYVTNYLRDEHCAIVSREVWDMAQKRRAAERGKRKASANMVMPP